MPSVLHGLGVFCPSCIAWKSVMSKSVVSVQWNCVYVFSRCFFLHITVLFFLLDFFRSLIIFF